MRRKAIKVKVQSVMEAEQQSTSAAAVTSSTSNKTSAGTAMVGFDDILVQILDQLTGVPESRRVIPIVGMGGIGKITLATHAFQHPLTVHYFDVCLWATISQQYKVEKILTELLCADESTSGTINDLGHQLHKSLYGRRYLIILDDMWSVQAWNEISFFFPDTNNGSQIVVTTRHANVANHLDVSSLAMSFLDEVKSWDLFCQIAFVGQVCPSELEEIGKKIVGKCKGLPLAIVVVAGYLRKSLMTLEYWGNVAHHLSSILNSTENEEQCVDALSLSYSYLPPHLKPCFLLLGAFPEDEEIYVWDVLKLWISEGFIETFENSSLELVAKHYLWDLFQRNLILVDQLGCDGEVYYFKLHDLVREFCIKISKREEILNVIDAPQAIHGARRVVINGKLGEANHTKTPDAPIRCLIYEGGLLSYDLKLLRTLDKVVASSMSVSIFHQVNLRYLHLGLDYKCCRNLYLPSSISLLWNLQILRITIPDQSTVIAPYEIWELLQLRHLEIDPVCLLDPVPVDTLGEENDLILRNLHTLLRVENLRLSEEVCKRIPHIRTLKLSYCDEAMSYYYCPHNLGYFHELEYLVCRFHGSSKWHGFALSLTFPASLKSLLLSGCGLDWEELTTMVGSLPHLISLELYPHSFIGSVWTPIEGKYLSSIKAACMELT